MIFNLNSKNNNWYHTMPGNIKFLKLDESIAEIKMDTPHITPKMSNINNQNQSDSIEHELFIIESDGKVYIYLDSTKDGKRKTFLSGEYSLIDFKFRICEIKKRFSNIFKSNLR